MKNWGWKETVETLDRNGLEYYVTAGFVVAYYLGLSERGADVDFVVKESDMGRLEEIFGGKFEVIPLSDGTKITRLMPDGKEGEIDFTLFNDFLLEGTRLSFAVSERVLTLTEEVMCEGVKMRMASLDLLVVTKLVMYRGESAEVACDKKDLLDLMKAGKYPKNLDEALDKVLPRIVEREGKIDKVKGILKERDRGIRMKM